MIELMIDEVIPNKFDQPLDTKLTIDETIELIILTIVDQIEETTLEIALMIVEVIASSMLQ
ncbi:hypothetical protein CD156_06900 [Staphylococcus capitis subsp. urealyticus]|nr:hypothetical protein CD156_06900 [Staphylococcus capitis subsp. urealyticus]